MWRQLLALLLVCSSFCWSSSALAATLQQRVEGFPNWSVATGLLTEGELTYPQWFAGEWTATSILREQVAPMAPDVVTPGFERNQANINRPYTFQVRFGYRTNNRSPKITLDQFQNLAQRPTGLQHLNTVVADRTFNGEQITNAYLGKHAVKSIQTIDQPYVMQVTRLQNGTELRSTVTGYLSESLAENRFVTTETTQQVFQGQTTYLNTVETTTSYQLIGKHHITADQITAIYLSPQDPEYFKALRHPVALYRYSLELVWEL